MLGPSLGHHCSAFSCSTLPLSNFALVVLALFASPTPHILFYSLLIPCVWNSVSGTYYYLLIGAPYINV